MVIGPEAPTTTTSVLSDAVLVERIAALGDRAALAELDGRHGMTLYAIAYTMLLNPDAADVTLPPCVKRGGAQRRSMHRNRRWDGGWLG